MRKSESQPGQARSSAVAIATRARAEAAPWGSFYKMGGGRQRLGTDLPKHHYERTRIRDQT